MKITYISHATLLIEVEDIKIVTDPWVKGASYCNQWHLFPKPLSPNLISDADYIIYSHGHEDHLNPESLQLVNKNATIFYPYSWYGGTTAFFNEQGFKNINEVVNEKTVHIGDNIKVTYLSNNLDNVIVIESGDTVLVNVNDALPSASASMIDYFIAKIKKRWKKIDYVFSSYGGAAYFPNTVHFAKKNDVEIGETRELFFITNFCKIVSGLNPKMAVPFATDFVLLDDNQRWINKVKFPREKIKEFYATFSTGATNVEIIEAYPNDYFIGKQFVQSSIYHQKKAEGNLLDTIDVEYKTEIEAKRNPIYLTSDETKLLIEKVKTHILEKQYIIPELVRKKIKFSLKIIDAKNENVLTISFRETNTLFAISNLSDKDVDLLIEIKSKTLAYALDNEWGGDAIIIGYGAEIFIYSEDSVKLEYENYCVRLLSRYPNTKEYLKKEPWRAIKYLLADDVKRNNLINKTLRNQSKMVDYSDPILGKRDLWLNKSKCDICKACNI
jgi:hypothetical protein